MVDFAAVTAFLTAPVLAWLNGRVVTAPGFPADFRPGRWLHILAWAGIVFLVAFGAVFLASCLGA
jgi:Mn2+/Fe2+ NRAMP family transporter